MRSEKPSTSSIRMALAPSTRPPDMLSHQLHELKSRRGELKAAMRSLGFETKNPTIFQMIADLDDGRAVMLASMGVLC